MVRPTRDRDFEVGESVLVRDYRKDFEKWVQGTVDQRTGPVSYRVRVGNDSWRCHADQLSGFSSTSNNSSATAVQPDFCEVHQDLPAERSSTESPGNVDKQPCVSTSGDGTEQKSAEIPQKWCLHGATLHTDARNQLG